MEIVYDRMSAGCEFKKKSFHSLILKSQYLYFLHEDFYSYKHKNLQCQFCSAFIRILES